MKIGLDDDNGRYTPTAKASDGMPDISSTSEIITPITTARAKTGTRDGVAAAVRAVCERSGAREVRLARDPAESERIWKGRKSAFGAMGRLSPTSYVQDGVIPRSHLPQVLEEVAAISRQYGLRVANVFHAGDGNLHPLILFDEHKPGQLALAIAAGADILRACVGHGGSISGEHGIGIEKRDCMPLQFNPAELQLMRRLRAVFDERSLCNPKKLFPTARRCGESSRTLQAGQLTAEIAAAAEAAF